MRRQGEKSRYSAVNMAKVVRALKGPESKVAAGLAGLVGVIGLGVAITMTSCEIADSASRRARRDAEPSVKRETAKNTTTPSKTRPSSVPPPASNAMTGEPQMRVRILTSVNAITIKGSQGLTLGQGDPRGVVALADGAKTEAAGPSLSIALKAGQWIVTDAGASKMLPATASLVLAPAKGSFGLQVNATTYPGVVRLAARTDVPDAFDAVNFVGVEDYLPGVVGKEMLAGWPLGAYQAQAVAARSYALQERERSMNAGQAFDVESSDRDQVFGGVTTNKVALQAVQSTRGVVLMDGGKVLRAYFSSTCGGRTASAKDTWPTGPGFEFNLAAPLQSYPRDSACNGSPLYRWTVERPRTELAGRLRLFGERNQLMVRRLKDLVAIEPMALTQDGRPSRYKIIEPGGTWYQLSAEELRLACNTSGSTPPLPTLSSSATPGTALAMSAAPSIALTANDAGGGSAGKTAPLPDVDRKTRVHSSDFEVGIKGDRAVISGRGFGHGVGLCQYCAKAFAERGEDWKTMLQRFYPGAKIEKLY